MMPAFFAKRGVTLPPNFNDNHSEDFSHGSTLKMDATDGGISGAKIRKRPRASIIVSIVLLCLLVGMTIAAGVCYVNHMHTMDDISRWVDGGHITPAHTISAPQDGLEKRQVYSYGQHPTVNVTGFTTPTAVSTVSTAMSASMTPSESFSETAPGVPVSVSPMQPGINSTVTETVTSANNVTVYHTAPPTSSATMTVPPGVNLTMTFNETRGSGSTLTGYISGTNPDVVTITGTVVPVPVSPNTTVTVDGVTGTPVSWPTDSSTLTLTSTISSTVIKSSASVVTISKTVTTIVGLNTTCTESQGSTATSNDAITATFTVSGSDLSSTLVPVNTPAPTTSISTTTCTDEDTSAVTVQPAPSSDTTIYSTETLTISREPTTVTLQVTETATVTASSTSSVQGVSVYSVPASADVTCAVAPTVTVTATVVQTITSLSDSAAEVTVKDISSPVHVSATLSTDHMSSSAALVASGVPVISIAADTTVIVSVIGQQAPTYHTITLGGKHTTAATDAVSLPSPTSSSSSGSLMPHDVSSLTVPDLDSFIVPGLTAPFGLTPRPTITAVSTHSMNGTSAMTMNNTATSVGTVYSTYTVMANHTSTGFPYVPVSAGSRRSKPMGGGKGASNNTPMPVGSCVILMVAIFTFFM